MVWLESAADKLAIGAAGILVQMDSQDVKRYQGQQPQQPATQVNVNHNTTINIDQRTIELAQLAQSLGAKELLIDGRSVPVAELLGTAIPVQTG